MAPTTQRFTRSSASTRVEMTSKLRGNSVSNLCARSGMVTGEFPKRPTTFAYKGIRTLEALAQTACAQHCYLPGPHPRDPAPNTVTLQTTRG